MNPTQDNSTNILEESMNSNRYSSPESTGSENDSLSFDALGCSSEIAWLFIPPIIGTVGGFVWYLFASFLVEEFVMPHVKPAEHAYGGAAILLFLPLSTFYGLLTGFATTVFGSTQRRYGGLALIVVAATTTVFTAYWWYQFENAADCSSKYVLFYPLYTLSILIGLAGTFFALKSNAK